MSSCLTFRRNSLTGEIDEASAGSIHPEKIASFANAAGRGQGSPAHSATTLVVQASALDPENAAKDPQVEALRQKRLAAFNEKWGAIALRRQSNV